MNTPRARPRQTPFRVLDSKPGALVAGTRAEIEAFTPYLRKAGVEVIGFPIDPLRFDFEVEALEGNLTALAGGANLALMLADVVGDDRLPLINCIDEALPSSSPLLVSCMQAGAQEQAAICEHPERVVGIGPLGVMSGKQVIELAPAFTTSQVVADRARAFLASGGLQVYQVGDHPGLVLARALLPVVNEAAFALTERVATAEDIDTAVTLGAGFPFGPLSWADEIGIDRVLLGLEYLVQATYSERYRPAPLLRRMAQAGWTGKAAGRGFFTYDAGAKGSR
ncbi:MAG TPA: 3-hydroxyacyl-CoA dehydrogenase family protein [Chloroflexota bacterium]